MTKTGYNMSATTKRHAKLNIETENGNNNGNYPIATP